MGQDHGWVVAAAQRFERPLLAYVRRLLGDLADARGHDVVQEAFLKLCRQARADVEPRLGPWLFTVCRRHVVDILRKENRMTALTDTVDPPTPRTGPAEVAETTDLSRAVLARLAGFPPSQQEAVRLKFLQQFSYREIAEVMGLSESHVGVLIHTALKKLRQAFADPLHTTGGVHS
ncbi:MAG TPA: sigma-70 family RNA polymerase sigma factor [Gemmataceae bacterium]|jgi:RNA polymerase sigma factor (sigma-70 family)|nr:sigma-70 family RNA polymerase sigma factor [Gemmataceae bacterium]